MDAIQSTKVWPGRYEVRLTLAHYEGLENATVQLYQAGFKDSEARRILAESGMNPDYFGSYCSEIVGNTFAASEVNQLVRYFAEQADPNISISMRPAEIKTDYTMAEADRMAGFNGWLIRYWDEPDWPIDFKSRVEGLCAVPREYDEQQHDHADPLRRWIKDNVPGVQRVGRNTFRVCSDDIVF